MQTSDEAQVRTNLRTNVIAILAVSYALFVIWAAATGGFPSYVQRALHVAFALVLVTLIKPSRWVPLDLLLIAASLVITGWIVYSFDRLFTSVTPPSTTDLVLGVVAIVVVLELCRRAADAVLPMLSLLFIFYALVGPDLPGVLRHVGFKPSTLIEAIYTGNVGFWGSLTGLAAGVISAFIVFGAALAVTGAGKTFIELAVLIAGRLTGGPAQVAVLASAFFGTISGSAVVNVATIGTFTIPMMKRTGFKPAFAAGVEATASTGGQIAPPVMGAGAFIMAEILGVPYMTVLVAAIFPALLYYAATAAGVYFYASREGLGGLDRSEIPTFRQVFQPHKIVCLAVPLFILLYLMVVGYTPQFAAWSASLLALIVKLLFVLMKGKAAILELSKSLIDNLRDAGSTIADITVLIATASVMVTMISITGLGVRVSEMILTQGTSGIDIVLAVGGAAIMALILGTALPTVPAYLISAAVLAPAIVKLGFPPLATHMFLYYYACLGSITPPLCTPVWIAASIAGARWESAARYAMILSMGGLIAPFLFIFHPSLLLLSGGGLGVAFDMLSALIGIGALSAAVFGFMLRRLGWVDRALLVICSALMIFPRYDLSLAGILMLLALVGRNLFLRKRAVVKNAS